MQKQYDTAIVYILLGVMIMAAGVEMFFAPSGFVAGGATGLGIVLNEIATKNFGIYHCLYWHVKKLVKYFLDALCWGV